MTKERLVMKVRFGRNSFLPLPVARIALVFVFFVLVMVTPPAWADLRRAHNVMRAQNAAGAQQTDEVTAPRQFAPVSQDAALDYALGTGDKIRVTVFGEDNLSGEFTIDGAGKVSMPLIGDVPALNQTIRQLARQIEIKLADGYLRDPKVNIEVLNYRPFFILGEVVKPGSYPFVSGMSVVNAVALAGGYTYRADKDAITLVRAADASKKELEVSEDSQVSPGDVVRVPERFF